MKNEYFKLLSSKLKSYKFIKVRSLPHLNLIFFNLFCHKISMIAIPFKQMSLRILLAFFLFFVSYKAEAGSLFSDTSNPRYIN